MIKFTQGKCPKCGATTELMLSNNPLSGITICFSCINQNLDYTNLAHGEFFCRTYNLPWIPELWIEYSKEYQTDTFKQYTSTVLEEKDNQPNLAYESQTKDLWARTEKEWEKCRSFAEILHKLTPIKESYIDRGRLKWGEQYTFEEIIKLDSIYTRTLRANNITNPMQKEAVKTLCKLQIEMDNAIRGGDTKAIKDYSAAWATFAKQADLESMINDTKTDDITTVAELYDYMEKSGYQFKYYDGADRDEVDRTIHDIQSTLRRTVLESTGLRQQLEDMAAKRQETAESQQAQAAAEEVSVKELMEFNPDDTDIETESDESAESIAFDQEN